jgi:hypothetical protein
VSRERLFRAVDSRVAGGLRPNLAAAADKLIAGRKDGTYDVFIGEITDQSGTVKVPKGQRMEDKDFAAINWYVKACRAEARWRYCEVPGMRGTFLNSRYKKIYGQGRSIIANLSGGSFQSFSKCSSILLQKYPPSCSSSCGPPIAGSFCQ